MVLVIFQSHINLFSLPFFFLFFLLMYDFLQGNCLLMTAAD